VTYSSRSAWGRETALQSRRTCEASWRSRLVLGRRWRNAHLLGLVDVYAILILLRVSDRPRRGVLHDQLRFIPGFWASENQVVPLASKKTVVCWSCFRGVICCVLLRVIPFLFDENDLRWWAEFNVSTHQHHGQQQCKWRHYEPNLTHQQRSPARRTATLRRNRRPAPTSTRFTSQRVNLTATKLNALVCRGSHAPTVMIEAHLAIVLESVVGAPGEWTPTGRSNKNLHTIPTPTPHPIAEMRS